MISTWDDMKYWDSGEWQWMQEKLDDLEARKVLYTPRREEIFAALDSTPLKDVRVAIVGQDPYPNPIHATGIAYSVPSTIIKLPATLVNIFRVYKMDLHYPQPTRGDLTKWTQRGVLLWNAIPTTTAFAPLSHDDWEASGCGWSWLTKEIVETLSEKGIVFVFMGAVARRYVQYVDKDRNGIIETSHPSPRGCMARPGKTSSWTPFLDSRLFSTINARLIEEGEREGIDWHL